MRRSLLVPAVLVAALAGCTGGEIGGSGTTGECGESDFVCGDGSCVPTAEQCNGTENCADGSDEDDCVTRCERTDYRCKDGNTCVSRSTVCDGRSDCPGGDDESTCAAKECDGFQCGDGSCIDPAAKCNGSPDCAGGEDESAVTCAPVTCPNADDLRCTDGRTCVTKAQQCDGVRHCPRGEDEGIKMCADGQGDPDGDGKGGSGGDGNKPHPGGGGGGGKPGGGGQGRPCGDVPEAGVCKDDQLVWCDHGRLERTDCRGDGKTCGQNADGNNACLDTDGEPEIDCGEMPEAGTCQGSTLLFCSENGEPRTEDCMAHGEQCVTDENGARCAPAAGTCGDIDYQGRCNGQVVEWCNSSGELETYDCALSGQACQFVDAETGYGCQAAPCGEVTYYGECNGDTLRYCADDTTLIEIDCMGEYGVGCGLEDDTIGYNCGGGGGDDGDTGGGCGDISYEGTCDGDMAVWCDEDALAQYDCSVQGKTCGYVDAEVGYWCVSPSGSSACGDIDYEGTCDGDWAVWCENDQIQYVDCSFDGGCGYVGDGAGYYCQGDGGGGDGGGSEVTSCDGLCGVGEVTGSDPICYCDDACVDNGDCCGGALEYDAVCGTDDGGGGGGGDEGSCYDWCGSDEPAPGSSCYCDDYCYDNGDCCADIDYYCY